MDLTTAAAILGILVIAIIATVIYILKTGAKPTQKAAVLYANWTEPFRLEPLQESGKKAADHNAKLLSRNLKLLWDKKVLEEVDLKPEIENLTQEQALAFTNEANELFLQKTEKAFVYDIRDARDGNLRLISFDKSDTGYKRFIFGQAIIKLLKEQAELSEFPDIEFPEGTETQGLSNLESFVIAQAGIDTDSEALYSITEMLKQRFGGEGWNVFLVSEDVLKFAKSEPEEPEEEEEDHSPFAQQLERKRLAEEAAAAEKERIELDRKLRWEHAEEEKRQAELAARDAAIAAGTVSPLIVKPHAFLSQTIEIAADDAGIFTLDDEVEIRRTDRIGNPTLFSVYSDDLIDINSEAFQVFSSKLIEVLEKNYGGSWSHEADPEQATSIAFAKSIL